jgi:predicted 3-demethylubiquinone-9 3-methyltransferase (glyoxalase superfamily)
MGTEMKQKITPFLWFNGRAEEAAKYYTGIFENSKIESVSRYPEGSPYPAGTVMTVVFRIAGQRFIALNGGAEFQFNESISFVVSCANQKEIDYYWKKLTAGGKEVQCGWLTDQFGVSWQIGPAEMGELFEGTAAQSERVMKTMLKMVKLDIAGLKKAYKGKG